MTSLYYGAAIGSFLGGFFAFLMGKWIGRRHRR